MAEAFDPYHKWLGISPKERPPNHYRLLALELFEGDLDVIEGAADQRMAHVRTFQTGQNSGASQRVLNELSAAKLCLFDAKKKAAYDEMLRRELAANKPRIGTAKPLQAIAVDPPVSVQSVVGLSRVTTRISDRRSKPVWQVPAVVGVAVVVVVAIVSALVRSSDRERTAKLNHNAEAESKAPTKPARQAKTLGAADAVAAAAEQQGNDGGKYLDVLLAAGVTMRLVKIPASADGNIKLFYLGQTEITQQQWISIIGNNPTHEPYRTDQKIPVNNVTLPECRKFCAAVEKASQGRGFTFRLPTETELLYACFMGMSPREAYGDDLVEYAWCRENSNKTMHPVGLKNPNALGLYDVLGNAWEWTDQEHKVVGGGWWEDLNFLMHGRPIGEDLTNDKHHTWGLRIAAEWK